MKRLITLSALAALALSPAAQAKGQKEKHSARQVVTRQQVYNSGTRRYVQAPTRTVVRHYSRGGYYGGGYYGGGYYGGGYYPYYPSSFSIGIGTGGYYGYPGYGYGYGYPYGYGSGYGDPYAHSTYRNDYYAGDNVVVQVQRRLARAGYYGGAVDGVAGARTRSAIARWEARHGMVADGHIDRELLRSLGIA